MMQLQKVDGCLTRGVELLVACLHSHLCQVSHIIRGSLGGIIGQKRVANAQLLHPFKKMNGKRKQRGSIIYGSVHVESNVLQSAQTINDVIAISNSKVLIADFHDINRGYCVLYCCHSHRDGHST